MGVVYDDEKPPDQPTGFAERVLDQIANSRRPTRIVYEDDPNAPPTGTQTGAIVKGMLPVVGPLVEKALTAVAAGGSPTRYREMQAGQEQYERTHPIASAIGGMGGAVMGVPAMRAAPRAFGGESFVGQTAAGAGWGGADAAIRSGGDVHETAKGAFIGGAAPTFGSLLAPIGQGIAAAGGAIGRGLGIAAPRAKLTPQGALDAGEAGFQSLGQRARYDPNAVDDLTNLMRRDFHDQSIATPHSAPRTHAEIADIGNLPPNPASLHNKRKQLQAIINNSDGAERDAAHHAKNMIDNFLESPPPRAVLTRPGQSANVFRDLEQANTNWRIGRTAETVGARREAARIDASASNNPITMMAEGPEIVKQFKNLGKNQRATRFMSPEDIADVGRVAAPQSLGERGLRLAGGLSGTAKPGVLTSLPVGGSFLAAGGDPTLAAILFATGGASQLGASALTRQAANAAEQSILARSPYGQAATPQMPNLLGTHPNRTAPQPSIGAIPYRNEIARLLALQGERSAVEP